ncbi:hypothetical protein TTHERM_00394600 (macronuclear) [Tetrahymena thermophila SB210]|uniref:Uncharacterized protein n=1 Tax=Tetrahymena thermophila (strain SB210) TaxID=312017 RepID=Q232Z3_TETTS|nr:hypothetical protein TTHERM_00394600 [Tetrahymena thermophila SB210]EAR91687.1 hypothetical protein TTHERM_00394600 [Tetrahymena thermophila SB210]|eukprot:XP_001011932.1 hypothetical protein TTHERM_00394600 [Tetrahymena thermophila SB210]
MELVFQKNFNNVNDVLTKIGQPTYKSVNEINIEQLDKLKGIRSKQSVLFNQRFLENNESIANRVNNVRVRAIISGVNLNLRYRQLPHLILYSDELRQRYSQYFWDYELIFRAGIFGVAYLLSELHYKLLQWILKHGIKIADKIVGYFIDKDSMNRQWFGALLISYLTYKFSSGIEKYFDIYSIYQGYKLYSDDFQSDIRNFKKSIDYFEKRQE